MNYAIIENESVCSDLENIAGWLREKDDNVSPKNRKRLDKLAKKYDKRKNWRNYSWEAEVSSNGYTNYWISKKQILNKDDWLSWR